MLCLALPSFAFVCLPLPCFALLCLTLLLSWIASSKSVLAFACFCLLGHAFVWRSVVHVLNLNSSWHYCLFLHALGCCRLHLLAFLLLAAACCCLLLLAAGCCFLLLAAAQLELKFKISSCFCLLVFAWPGICTAKYGIDFELEL